MKSPYTGLASRSYWRSGVVERHPLDIGDIYLKKFVIRPDEGIATAGSCFAQHIAQRLREHGYRVIDAEPPPGGLSLQAANEFGFRLYSARYGNIYTVRQMLQLVQECDGLRSPIEPVWEKGGRYFDALRPSVEPDGLASRNFVIEHRKLHLARVRWLLGQTSLFVFTMGLTEAWVHLDDGTVYPTAAGTIVGSHDPGRYGFKNFTYTEVLGDFLELRELLRARNPNMRFLLTVSPVPLTATAGDEHVLPATVYSKSVLRAVAGHLASSFADIDYFPSYEIIAGTPARGFFYESNLRSVSPAGVDVVMRSFFNQHGRADATINEQGKIMSGAPTEQVAPDGRPSEMSEYEQTQRVLCDEELLNAFAP
jgi:hypothetical protein